MPEHQFSKPTPVAIDPVGSLVGEFMEEKKKERQEEKARQAVKKRSPFVVPLLVVVCLATWFAPALMPPREQLAPETLEQGARLTLYLASVRVRAYANAHKRLPPNLQQAGVDTTGITYLRTTESVFELSTRVQGTRLVYRSTLPDSVFLGPKLRIRGIG